VKIGIVGLGYWGPNLVRNFLAAPMVNGVIVFDQQPKKTEKILKRFPGIEACESFEKLIARPDIQGIAIATPVSTHYELGMKVLQSGKHLLIEKPMCASVKEAIALAEYAEKHNLIILIDHTFIYTGAVQKIKELIIDKTIGDLLYFDSVRINLGLFQHDTNVIWDLAPHDVSIMHYLIDDRPTAVTAIGVNHYNGFDDMAYITIQHTKKMMSHFHVNWLSPVKIRRILIGGSKHMVVYDDMNTDEKVRVYDKGVEITSEESIYTTLIQYRIGEMHAPKIEEAEALSLMISDFIKSIHEKVAPITDAKFGVAVMRVLEAADNSLKSGGKTIYIED
jgi:predicted dehydrogenase